MIKPTDNKKKARTTVLLNKSIGHSLEHPVEFYISEETATYGNNGKKPFTVYYDNPEYSLKLLKGDCIEILNKARENSVDMIFADPPYFLSKGVKENHEFTLDWLRACQRVLKPNGTIWVSGTTHIIYSIGFAMQELGYKILNDIIWYKRNAPPNLSCRYFTHSTEIVLWAAKNEKAKHHFDYQLMKKINQGKQMRNVWEISAPLAEEKKFGKHPTQKPVELLKRIILSSTKENDLVLDPFCGSSTTGVSAILLNRKYVGIDLEDDYLDVSEKRIQDTLSPQVCIQADLHPCKEALV